MPETLILAPFEIAVQLISAIVVLEMFFYIWQFRSIHRARESVLKFLGQYSTFRRGLLFIFIGLALHFSGDLFIPVSQKISLILYALAFAFIFGGLLAHLLVLYLRAAAPGKKNEKRKRRRS